MPLGSAVIVTVLGIGIAFKGLATYRSLPGFGQCLAILAGIVLIAVLLGKRLGMLLPRIRRRPPTVGDAVPLMPKELLPPRYRDGHPVSAAPMGAAPLVYDAAGRVAWDRIWGGDDPEHPFCDLALAGRPPHRGRLVEPPTADPVAADPAGYTHVRTELGRGLRMVTGLDVTAGATPEWIGLVCDDAEMAAWLALAVGAENVTARHEDATLFLPASPSFRLDKEIKNVLTAVAKAHHYWTEHAQADGELVAV